MTMVGSLGTARAAYSNERATRKPRPPRVPLAIRLGRAAAKLTPRWATIRALALDTGGLGLLSYAAWEIAHPAGIAAAGVSCLLLSWRSG
ncbi:MAG TPA: hypothetical protein VE465_02135 [Streptosporangiaceae bacterium]|jgi:hypothetical protein|nr:hypothetical protein [Streptosporangiaceae bacterium]